MAADSKEVSDELRNNSALTGHLSLIQHPASMERDEVMRILKSATDSNTNTDNILFYEEALSEAKQNRLEDSLYSVVRTGDVECVSQILRHVTTFDMDKMVGLLIVYCCNSLHMFELIKNSQPDIFANLISGSAGTIWLYNAANKPSVHLLEFLLQNGARGDNDVLTKIYQTASQYGKHSDVLEICRLILVSGVDPNTCTSDGSEEGLLLPMAVENNDLPFIKMLIDKGVDVNCRIDEYLDAALLSNCNLETMRFLIDNKAEVNFSCKDTDGYEVTPLMFHSENNNYDNVLVLIEKGADLNFVDIYGYSALSMACYNDSFDCFTALLSAGADVNVKGAGEGSKTLLSQILGDVVDESFCVHTEYILLLLKHGAKTCLNEWKYIIHKCVGFNELNILSALIHYGGFGPCIDDTAPHDTCFRRMWSPFFIALVSRQYSVAEDMLRSWYLTVTDLTLLPKCATLMRWVHECAQSGHSGATRAFNSIHEMSTNPPSLKLLSFVHVSDLVGCHPGRQTRIQQLGLPVLLQKSLMFSCKNQIVAPEAFAAIDSIVKGKEENVENFEDKYNKELWPDSDTAVDLEIVKKYLRGSGDKNYNVM